MHRRSTASLEEPIAGAIPVGPDIRYVLTEGNYLLLDTAPWPEAAALLDEVWFLDPGDDERVRRLVDRHVRYGRTADQGMRRATAGQRRRQRGADRRHPSAAPT